MKLGHRLFNTHTDDGEKILSIAHRHILIFKFDAAKTFFFGIMLPAFFYYMFPQFWLAFAIWGGVGFFGIVYHFIDWFYDAWILTDSGVIDIERNGLFDVTSTRIDYHMIEGIAYTIKGVIPTLFNYGDITIDKLGAKTSVKLIDAASSKKLERLVMKYQEKYVFERSVRDHSALKDMLSEMIAYHVHNKKVKVPKRD